MVPMSSYLILGQQGVANTCEQHHGYKEWNKTPGRHIEYQPIDDGRVKEMWKMEDGG
jgi:hypothetical protein